MQLDATRRAALGLQINCCDNVPVQTAQLGCQRGWLIAMNCLPGHPKMTKKRSRTCQRHLLKQLCCASGHKVVHFFLLFLPRSEKGGSSKSKWCVRRKRSRTGPRPQKKTRRTSTQRPTHTCTSATYPWNWHGQLVRNRSLQQRCKQKTMNCLPGHPRMTTKRAETCQPQLSKTSILCGRPQGGSLFLLSPRNEKRRSSKSKWCVRRKRTGKGPRPQTKNEKPRQGVRELARTTGQEQIPATEV